jgi:hypothetical protein
VEGSAGEGGVWWEVQEFVVFLGGFGGACGVLLLLVLCWGGLLGGRLALDAGGEGRCAGARRLGACWGFVWGCRGFLGAIAGAFFALLGRLSWRHGGGMR